jgi:hypothetical protein
MLTLTPAEMWFLTRYMARKNRGTLLVDWREDCDGLRYDLLCESADWAIANAYWEGFCDHADRYGSWLAYAKANGIQE